MFLALHPAHTASINSHRQTRSRWLVPLLPPPPPPLFPPCSHSLQVYDEDLHELEPHFRFYYDCLMRPNSRSVLGALRKVETAGWQFNQIATGHGPLLRYNVAELMGKYESWSKSALEKQASSVAVLYVSDYGYSDRLSQVGSEGPLSRLDLEKQAPEWQCCRCLIGAAGMRWSKACSGAAWKQWA